MGVSSAKDCWLTVGRRRRRCSGEVQDPTGSGSTACSSLLSRAAGHVGKQLQVTAGEQQEEADEILDVWRLTGGTVAFFFSQSEWAQVASRCNKASVCGAPVPPAPNSELHSELSAPAAARLPIHDTQLQSLQQSAEFLSAVCAVACNVNFNSNRIHHSAGRSAYYNPFSWNICTCDWSSNCRYVTRLMRWFNKPLFIINILAISILSTSFGW